MYEIITFKIFYIKINIKFFYIRMMLRIYKYFKIPKKTKDNLGKKISKELYESFKEVRDKCQFTLEEIELMKSYLK